MRPTRNESTKIARPTRTRTRAVGAASAVAAAVIVWAIVDPLLGVELAVTPGTDEPQIIGLGSVVTASGIAVLIGWGSLALLERVTSRGRTAWRAIAVMALLGSMAGPLAGVSTAVTVSLVAMHLAVGVVLIVALGKS